MRLKEISMHEFDNYAINHPLGSYHQSSMYALVMAENGYDYDCIAYFNDDDKIVAATLILHKKIGLLNKYGYSPKGFLIDYNNKDLLKRFTKDLKMHYQKKGFVFIKINPEIAIGELKDNSIKYNKNQNILENLEKLGYKPLKRNIYFESLIPKFNAILPLTNYSLSKISKHTRNKIKKSSKKGLQIEFGNRDSIDILYNFVKNKKDSNVLYYKDYYNVFSKKNLIDVVMVKINSGEYLVESKKRYEEELERNSILAENLTNNPTEKNINLKMSSDTNLAAYKEDMIEASNNYGKNNKEIYIAGALVIKHQNRINIYISGYDKNFKNLSPNYFLHNEIFEYYKNDYEFADLNGMTGDFTKNNPYYGLNKFKEGFKPFIYEFIGELDLIIDEKNYNKLIKNGSLAEEFNKEKIINKN